ncbi:MAG: hypothetical protein WBD36_05325, partial [Bacteroidota bacterium]
MRGKTKITSEARPTPLESETIFQRRIAQMIRFLESSRRTALNLFLLAAGGVLLFLVIEEVSDSAVAIEEYEVAGNLGEASITGRNVANMLFDEIEKIKRKAIRDPGVIGSLRVVGSEAQSESDFANARKPSFVTVRFQLMEPEKRLEVHLPETGFSLRFFASPIREALGLQSTRITGDLLREGDDLRMVTRVVAGTTEVISLKGGNLDQMIGLSAEHVLKFTQPIVLSWYY